MEVDFDKEIDALLRSSSFADGVAGGDHLDADTLAAFAENALPESARQLYTTHISDCSRCRKILSDVIAMNAEAEPVSAVPAAAPVVAAETVPWYRRLFLFPNLAYVMGGLVLIFSGFIGYTVLQNSTSNSVSEISQISDEERPVSGPNVGSEPGFAENFASNANMANSTAAAANTTANAATIVNTDRTALKDQRIESIPTPSARQEAAASADALTAASEPPPPPPVMQAPPDPAGAGAEIARKAEDQMLAERDKADTESKLARSAPAPAAGRSAQAKRNAAPPQDETANSYAAPTTRSVGGRSFERKQGIWYDAAYSGQSTTNVRRGTESFRNLDSGLQTIANSLDGTVVVVWGRTAYKIQ